MQTLMLPEDERAFVEFVTDHLGLVLLATELTAGGEATIVEEPLSVLPAALPGLDKGAEQVIGLTFWCQAAGPLRTLVDAPPRPPVPQLLWRETQQARYPDRWPEVVDASRSPVLRLVRSRWTGERSMSPGEVQAMNGLVPFGAWSPEIQGALARTREWITQRAQRVASPRRPRTIRERRAQAVWALPDAAAWLAGGGVIDRRRGI